MTAKEINKVAKETKTMDSLPTIGITTEMLNTYFTPILIKVVAPTVIIILIASIILGIVKKCFPPKIALLLELVIKIVAIIIIGYATVHAVNNIQMPSIPQFSEEADSPFVATKFEENYKK